MPALGSLHLMAFFDEKWRPDDLMLKVWIFKRYCLCSLLLAVAMQGITPDANDLASLRLFRLVLPATTSLIGILNDDAGGMPRGASEDTTPHRQRDGEESPSEVCLCPNGPQNSPWRRFSRPLEGWGHAAIAVVAIRAEASELSSSAKPHDRAASGDLIRLHCRLSC